MADNSKITIITERELRECVALDSDTIACIERCFRLLATEAVVMPPIMRLDIHANNGEVDVKTAYLPGVESFAIKISPGFFDNPTIGLPSTGGLMNLFSATTGLLEAVLLDNGYLTDLRTAAAGAVAAKWLSNESASSVAVIGAGMQAKLQLSAITQVRTVRAATVWARNAEKAEAFATTMSDELAIPVTVAPSVAAAIKDAAIIVTTTPSTEPLLHADDLQPGQHITAMGSDAEHKNELHPTVLARADHYFCDRISQVAVLGELHHAIESGGASKAPIAVELGDIVAQLKPARSSVSDITVCDLTGTGAQDTAIATLARERALQSDRGMRLKVR